MAVIRREGKIRGGFEVRPFRLVMTVGHLDRRKEDESFVEWVTFPSGARGLVFDTRQTID